MAATKTLKLRSSGEEVKQVQTFLKKRMKLKLKTDGKFTTETEEAVRAFQTKQKLKVDGMVGPKTYGAIAKAGGDVNGVKNGSSTNGGGSGDTKMLKSYRANLAAACKAADALQQMLTQTSKEAASIRDDSKMITLPMHQKQKEFDRGLKALTTAARGLSNIEHQVAASILE